MNIDKITKSDKLFLENHKEQIIKNDWKHLIRDLLSNYSEYDVLRILKVFRKANVAVNTGDLFKSSGYIVFLFMQIIDEEILLKGDTSPDIDSLSQYVIWNMGEIDGNQLSAIFFRDPNKFIRIYSNNKDLVIEADTWEEFLDKASKQHLFNIDWEKYKL